MPSPNGRVMSRVVKQVVDRLKQPLRDSVGTERLKLRVKRDRGGVSLGAGDRVRDQLVEAKFFEALFRGVSRASSIRLVTRVVSSSLCSTTSESS